MQPDSPTTPVPPPADDDLNLIRNRVFDDIAVGDRETLVRTLTTADIQLFAVLSGDANPQHLDPAFAASTRFHGVIAHGMFGGALISAVLGTRLPGPGTIYLGQTLKFLAPVRIGDMVEAKVEVVELIEKGDRARLRCTCSVDGQIVLEGEALVKAPREGAPGAL